MAGKSRKQSDKKHAVTITINPADIPERDKVFFNATASDDINEKYIIATLELRFCASYKGDKSGSKPKTPLNTHSIESFCIFSIKIDDIGELDILVFKPNLYFLGVYVSGHWRTVSDFMEYTGVKCEGGKNLLFSASYEAHSLTPISKFSILNAVKGILKAAKSGVTFKSHYDNLCNIFAEPSRFNHFLFTFAPAVGGNKVVILNRFEQWMINNWDKLSLLLFTHDLGYVFNLFVDVSAIKYLMKAKGRLEEENKKGKEEEKKWEEELIRIDPEFEVDVDGAKKLVGLLHHPSAKNFFSLLNDYWVLEKYQKQQRSDDCPKVRRKEYGSTEIDILDSMVAQAKKEKEAIDCYCVDEIKKRNRLTK